jgi:hypothetical protein
MKRLGRIVVILILVCLGLLLIPLGGVAVECRPFGEATPPQTAGAASPPAEIKKITADLPGYARPEDQTYLTLPEWYIVYSADEYAAFIAHNPPSRFPYFQAVQQYWQSYYNICAVTREQYPFNSGYHLTLVVIGTSFTVENVLKGLYENTVGRLTETLSSDDLTEEDAYARQVAKDYGDFIHTIPWYEFPFDQKFGGLWHETNLWGANPVRKWERKFALSLEYRGKALYGRLIGQGTQAAYAPEDLEIQAWTEGLSAEVLQQEPHLRMVTSISPDAAIVALPRYEAFTQIVPRLTRQGMRFVELAGNDEILVTALAPQSWAYPLPEGQLLFTMPILTQPDLKRVAVKAPLTVLPAVLAGLEADGVKLEHIYDY